MTKQRFESVWDAIEDTPGEALAMQIRSELMMQIKGLIRDRNWSQVEAAREMGITQPRVSDLMCGKIGRFSTEGLIDLLERANARVEVTVTIDRGTG